MSNVNSGEHPLAKKGDAATVAKMQAEIDLSSSSAISTYGNLASSGAAIDALSQVIEQAPTTALADKIAEIVLKLEDADPRKIAGKPSWLKRITGADLENKVLF